MRWICRNRGTGTGQRVIDSFQGSSRRELTEIMSGIGTLNEGPLHASLKKWYARPGDRFEVPVDGFIVDIVREDLLLEIQTGTFASIRSKLKKLSVSSMIRLIHPVPMEKWIVKIDDDLPGGRTRRKSPKHGRVEDVFNQMVSIPSLLCNPNLSLEVLMTREDEIRVFDGRRGWRRGGWVIADRILLDVVENLVFEKPEDWLEFIPDELDGDFTTGDLADSAGIRLALAQKMVYCLSRSGVLLRRGRRSRSYLYCRSDY